MKHQQLVFVGTHAVQIRTIVPRDKCTPFDMVRLEKKIVVFGAQYST